MERPWDLLGVGALCVGIVFLCPLCHFYVHALWCSTCQSVLGRIAWSAARGAWENRRVGACTWKGSWCRVCAREEPCGGGVSLVRLLCQYSNQVVNNKCVINAVITIIIYVIYNALYIPSFQTMHWSESWVNKWVQRLFVVSCSTNAALAWKKPQKHNSNKTIEMSFMQESIYLYKFINESIINNSR